ncbi:uncharacterized protein BDZ99DRAFT_504730 [Mytilinidion resinicola]|uniref:Uncharacterized protein n=1 Tax=Mytilinidion resinicola TaxID=574789 RepID=A0A6A6XXT0_9PEZI|nr:uncharacterized protein BDZ99DRAFT_504730 [Mytilinidion resinicola]KAF2801292.1 hypothetical protein BDZ99DRAFT_504730 [Mytilinidion resinicola]
MGLSQKLVLALTGCVSNSPGIPNIFLLKLQPTNKDSAVTETLQVRIGYFGMCLGESQNLTCFPGSSEIDQFFQSHVNGSATDNSSSKRMVSIAGVLQSKIFVCLFAAAGVSFFVGLIFLVLLKHNLKDRKNPFLSLRRFYKQATVAAIWFSAALALAGNSAVLQTSGALQYFTTSVET